MVHAEARTYFLENLEISLPQIRRLKTATLSSLRSPNARNKFAFALGDRKLLATLKFLNLKLDGQRPQLFWNAELQFGSFVIHH
jgi:hypothetical protein